MKVLLLLCLVAGYAQASNVKVTSQSVGDFEIPKSITITDEKLKNTLTEVVHKLKNRLEMNIDDVIDEVLPQIVDLFLSNNLDPMRMPDIHLGFEYKPLLITYHGEIDLWNGWLQDVITIHRSGESSLDLQGNIVRAKIPIGFDDIIATYLYSAKLMDLGPHGSIHAKLFNLVAYLDVNIDMTTVTMSLNEFYIDASEIGLNFYGYGLIDWLVNVLIDVVEDIFHNTIVDVINSLIGGLMDTILGYINDILGSILGRQINMENVPVKPALEHVPKINLRQILKH